MELNSGTGSGVPEFRTEVEWRNFTRGMIAEASDHIASSMGASFARVETACSAMLWIMTSTVVQASARMVTLYFSADFEIAV